MIQIVKQADETWQVTHVETLWKNAHEYTVIGRVLRDGLYYYAEVAQWHEAGYEYRRLPRGYLLAKPAFKALVAETSREKTPS